MEITVSLPDIFIKSSKHSSLRLISEARFDNCKLDCKRVLEVEKGRNHVKA